MQLKKLLSRRSDQNLGLLGIFLSAENRLVVWKLDKAILN